MFMILGNYNNSVNCTFWEMRLVIDVLCSKYCRNNMSSMIACHSHHNHMNFLDVLKPQSSK